MTIDEAIKHCEEEAEKYMEYGIETECYQCGKDHEQLASWLKELKERRAADGQPTERVIELKELLEECRRKFLFFLDCEIENTITAQQVRKLIEKIKAEEV